MSKRKRIVTHMRVEFGKRKKDLPKGLEFLEGIAFYAIAEHKTDNNKKQTRIEFLPRSLRNIVERAKKNNELIKKLTKSENTIAELKSDMETYRLIAKNYEQLKQNIKDGVAKEGKSPKNYLNIAEEKGLISNGSAVQGGLPGLGKKR